jgi:integrase
MAAAMRTWDHGLGKQCRKDCKMQGQDWNKCECPWYGKLKGTNRIKLDTWIGKPVDSKTRAREVVDLMRGEVLANRFDSRGYQYQEPNLNATRSVGDLLDSYQERHLAHKKDKNGTWMLKAFRKAWGELPVKELEKAVLVLDFLSDAEKANKWAPATYNRWRARLSHLLQFAVQREWIASNPFLRPGLDRRSVIPRRREEGNRQRRLSDGEEKALLDAARALPTAPGRMMEGRIVAALDTGMRRGEILQLQRSMIDYEEWLIKIPRQITKSNRDRVVPVETERLRRFLQTRRFLKPDSFVFGTAKGKEVADIKNIWDRVREAAGCMDLHFHDLRHECASRMIKEGADVADVRDVLGHSSIMVTNRYVNTQVQDLRKALRRLNRPEPKTSATPVLRKEDGENGAEAGDEDAAANA